MSNDYFSFKQFTVTQSDCAMKVSTDACILGAYTQLSNGQGKVLDIGAGTGVLALMVAQRYSQVMLTCVELDKAAADQCVSNVRSSPFAVQIVVVHHDILTWSAPHKFDAIVCNPPYFHRHLHSNNDAKRNARHTVSLDFDKLACQVELLSAANGEFWCILPLISCAQCEAAMLANGWVLGLKCSIQHSPASSIHRVVLKFIRSDIGAQINFCSDHFSIKDNSDSYSARFIEMMEDYYLHL
jgi:tRNA1Val (adenine37-N6)-methyltransferase